MLNNWEKGYQEKGISFQRQYPNEAMLGFLAGFPKGSKVLEIGCGSGANLWAIAKRFKAYGIDNSPMGIELCKKVLKDWKVKAELSVGNMQNIPYVDDYFDAIIDIVSMQHLDLIGHKKTYQAVYNCLKEGGKFFSYHLGSNSDSFKGEQIDRCTIKNIPKGLPLEGNGVTCFLDSAETRKLLSIFKNINIETYTRTYGIQLVEYLAITAVK